MLQVVWHQQAMAHWPTPRLERHCHCQICLPCALRLLERAVAEDLIQIQTGNPRQNMSLCSAMQVGLTQL